MTMNRSVTRNCATKKMRRRKHWLKAFVSYIKKKKIESRSVRQRFSIKQSPHSVGWSLGRFGWSQWQSEEVFGRKKKNEAIKATPECRKRSKVGS